MKIFNSKKSFVIDENNELIVDFIGKLENIDRDFNYVQERLNIKTNLPHVNKSKHKPYYEYFDKRTSNQIIEAFEEDFNFLDMRKN